MTEFSRRQFLQLAGVAVLGQTMGFDLPDTPTYGRALTATPVYQTPYGPISTHLWPDTMLTLRAALDDWYQVDGGYVRRIAVQPIAMTVSHPGDPVALNGQWISVNAPSTSVRQWCAADAPLVTRIGHGGVMRVNDQLPGSPAWYGVGYVDGQVIGWTQAPHWVPIRTDIGQQHSLNIVIQQHHMTVYHGSVARIAVPVAVADNHLPTGEFSIAPTVPGAPQADYEGVPWQLQWDDNQTLSGVYWHNRFGETINGPTVQTTPVMARWLYRHLGPASRLIVRA